MRRVRLNQRGFTLIEIVMVIVLLGIIAAIAIPKYVDLKDEAEQATADGIVAAIVSSAAIGYADRVVHKTGTYPDITTLDTTYLQVQQVSLNADYANDEWTATIGDTLYTFTYTDDGADAGAAGHTP
ncbi:MAG: type II secretion system protein [Syntrophobacteria bacterium]